MAKKGLNGLEMWHMQGLTSLAETLLLHRLQISSGHYKDILVNDQSIKL